MLAQWTGDVVGQMHLYGIKSGELAKEAGMHEKYLSAILNCRRTSNGAEKRIKDALERLITRKNEV